MCTNSMNEYALYSAANGVQSISQANPYLDGSGNLNSIYTAGEEGAIIKSITIKATQATLEGIVRLFIASDLTVGDIVLYKEVIIPTVPFMPNTPTPAPQYMMFETKLVGDFKLNTGYQIVASTQNAEDFNVIVEALEWEYPATQPTTCCNFKQSKANTGLAIVSQANPNLDGTGDIVSVIEGAENGTLLKALTVKALQSTHQGVIRFFISADNGTTWRLMQEILIPQSTQSTFQPSFKTVVDFNFNLMNGYSIGASTQNAEKFAITAEGEDWQYAIK